MLLNLSNYSEKIEYRTIDSDCYVSFTLNNSSYNIAEYHLKMIKENRMDNFTDFNYFIIDDTVTFNYKVTSLISLDYFLKNSKLTRDEVISLLRGMINAFKNISLYQLNANCICFDMEYMYIDINTFEPYLLYFPVEIESAIGYIEFKKFVTSLILNSQIEVCSDNFIQILLLQLNEKEFSFSSWEKLLLDLINNNSTSFLERNQVNNINYNKAIQGQTYESKPKIDESVPATQKSKKIKSDISSFSKKEIIMIATQFVFFVILIIGFNTGIIDFGLNLFLFTVIVGCCNYLLYKQLYPSEKESTTKKKVKSKKNLPIGSLKKAMLDNKIIKDKPASEKTKFVIFMALQIVIAIVFIMLVVTGVLASISEIFPVVIIILGVDYLVFNNIFIKEKKPKEVKIKIKEPVKVNLKDIPTNDVFSE